MRRVRLYLTLTFAILAVGNLTVAPVSAQDGWSFVITPQMWVSHIEKNGFTPPSVGNFFVFTPATGNVTNPNPLKGENSEPVDAVDPQWGLQFAAQKGRWTFAVSFQHVDFETRSDVIFDHPNVVNGPAGPFIPGERQAQELITTERMDMDVAVSYLFPDVVPNLLDLSLGGGAKVIYAQASRQFFNVLGPLSAFTAGGLYSVCDNDLVFSAPNNCVGRDRVKTTDWLYGATIPMSAIFHLANDAKWLLPVSITPFIGAETRDDRNVNYRNEGTTLGNLTVKRLDGTTFAYGVTADATVRYILNDSLSVYGGMRAQYINGFEEFLAYGPIVGMSVRFGGK